MRNSQLIAAFFAIASLSGCGETKTGSNGTGAVPTQREAAFVSGTLVGVDSFTIGVADLALGEASIRKDEEPNAGPGALRLGMSFEGTGTVLGSLGFAPMVVREGNALSAARGPVTSVDAGMQRFRMATLTFMVDSNTIYDGVGGIAGLTPGNNIEVSGLLLAEPDTLLATRIALPAPTNGLAKWPRLDAPANGSRVEIEGIALEVQSTGQFSLRTPARDYRVGVGATTNAPVTNGARVRVMAISDGGTSLNPTSIHVVNGPITYRVTGNVSEFSSLASLRVRGEPVDLTTAVIRGGNAAEITNGKKLSIVAIAGPGALRVTDATLVP